MPKIAIIMSTTRDVRFAEEPARWSNEAAPDAAISTSRSWTCG